MRTDKREQRIEAKRLAEPAMRAMTLYELKRGQVLSRGHENDRWHREASSRELIRKGEPRACAELHIDHETGWGAECLTEKLIGRCECLSTNLENPKQPRERETHGLVVIDDTDPVLGGDREGMHFVRRTGRWSKRKGTRVDG